MELNSIADNDMGYKTGDVEIDEFIELELKFFEALDKKHENTTPTSFIDMEYEDLFFDYL